MNELTREWVEKAEQDFSSADLLLHAGEAPIPDTASFHCQQCAEKYLKAYLQEHSVEFEWRHDLMPLLELCLSLDGEFEKLKSDLRELDRYAVIVRYPGVTIDAKTATAAFAAAKRVRGFLLKKLKIK